MSERPTILVTGAAGFIGARVCEVLHLSGAGEVRPVVRRWSSAARVGRLPLALQQCDVTDPRSVRRAMEGVQRVVHCAVGTPETNVEGTRNVMEAALEAGVEKVVHLSTVSVYGAPEGAVDEEHPLVGGTVYGDSKLEAERVCFEARDRGLAVTLLRPTIVYGPFSADWTVEFAQRLAAVGYLVPRGSAGGRCNLVYVDDLVRAVRLALGPGRGDGGVFNVNGPDDVTWWEYFQALNQALGLPPLSERPAGGSRLRSTLFSPVRRAAKLAIRHLEDPIMWLYRNSGQARRVMKWGEGLIRTTPNAQEFHLYSRAVHYRGDRVRQALGFVPRVAMQEGVDLSARWLRHLRFVP
jgi:nucleoside-diphosphate-sugar epimerase